LPPTMSCPTVWISIGMVVAILASRGTGVNDAVASCDHNEFHNKARL
jgi:hypothetical protein